jgi:hypothetical protein
MLYFVIIEKNDSDVNIILNKLLIWLSEKSSKWIINCLDNNYIHCIFDSILYSTTTKLTRALLIYCFGNIKNINNNNKIITTKLIKNDNHFNIVLKTISNSFDLNIFINNIKIQGFTKQYLLKILKSVYKSNKNYKCELCDKEFSRNDTLTRHINNFCKENKKNTIEQTSNTDKIINNTINNITNNITNHITNNTNNNTTNNTTNITNNIQNNLNIYLNNTIDMDTFIEKFKNDPKYQLNSSETEKLYELASDEGTLSYGNNLMYYLKRKYKSQLKDINNIDIDPSDCVLPFVNTDSNLRTHYEKTPDGWVLIKNDDKIQSLVIISNDQIFNHHKKLYYLSARNKKRISNILLKKSDYKKINFEKINIQMKKQ